ncbi:MAG TPA: DUF1549 and DUF1553 domain-containing protein [Verrucomicrobiae bacterium]
MKQAPPKVKARRWPRQSLDFFILARLESKGLSPSIEAGRRILIRRVTFDLTGLPPTPEEVESFLTDKREDAYERLVGRLLDSPRFGERMASLWLPLARYAEDQAHQVGADTKYFYPNAWRYRAWVIQSFNEDLPYDRFVSLQLAADRLEGTNSPNLAALGFLGLGPKYYDRDRLSVQADEWEDRVDTVSRAMLGLTVACARCHDHKFDPITMRDYYAMAGVFASTRMVNLRPDGSIEKVEKGEKGDVKATNMGPATLHIVQDSDQAQDLPVFLRGNVDRKGPVVERRFLRVLSRAEPAAFKDGSGRKELAAAIADRGNPLTARVMVNRVWAQFFGKPFVVTPSNFGHSGQPPTHPELLDDLAVRFMDNGWSVKSLVREIVLSATYRQTSGVEALQRYSVEAEDNSRPHDLRFNGSTLQPFNASTVQPSNRPTLQPFNESADSANDLFWRMNRRRLSIEQWRDAVLFTSGELDWSGGQSLELDDPTNCRRTVHARVSRLKLNDLLVQFDYPDANVHAEKRGVTTTALQKLFVLNSPFMLERAKALAARLHADLNESDAARVARAYRLLFGREPSREESALALDFLRRPGGGGASRWEHYAQLLLASNEMMYVD